MFSLITTSWLKEIVFAASPQLDPSTAPDRALPCPPTSSAELIHL